MKSRWVPILDHCFNLAPKILAGKTVFPRIHAVKSLAPVVQKVDSAIQRINHYPVDSTVGFANAYPVDSDLSGG